MTLTPACLDKLPAEKIAVAVSGGGDSLALLLLLRDAGADIVAFTVDHGLRPEAAAEAQSVARLCEKIGVPHKILHWTGDKPESRIQERARQARRHLLLAACRDAGIRYLALAHNREDQAETFWMRLSHGSGPDGLAGMDALTETSDGIAILRPLLSCSRADLRDYCVSKNISWVEDPSNINPKYLRPRLRAFEDLLAGEGLTPDRLLQTMHKMAVASQALDVMTARARQAGMTAHDEGYFSFDMSIFRNDPADIRRRLLASMIAAISGERYPPTYEAVEAVCDTLLGDNFTGRVLAGCEIFMHGGKMLVTREESAVAPRMRLQDGMIWDHRFCVEMQHPFEADIGVLGEEGLLTLRKKNEDSTAFDLLPFKVKKTLPAIWQGEKLLFVPHLSGFLTETDAGRVRLSFQPSFKVV